MATIERFEDIESWKIARQLCRKINDFINAGRFQRNYSLINQVRASSGSIMDNIAEGFERGTKAEFIMFLGYAKGSCGELRSQLYRTLDFHFLSQVEFEELLIMTESISRLLQKFIGYLQKTTVAGERAKHNKKTLNFKP
jgi:four helix bundle protein